ncbi:MAG: rhodanese-like domain-containing protein [Opitutus sp.]|nr:rhodanese-like domain-containing protein [Opitutus sp.]
MAAVEILARVRSGEAILIDVREPREWTAGVAERAWLLPLSDLTGPRRRWLRFLVEHPGRETYVYCKSGGRSAIVARILAAEGFRAANAGSLAELVAAGWSVVPPPCTEIPMAE